MNILGLISQLIGIKILRLTEFASNNSYQASIRMAPYEALYGRRCRSSICWDEVGERKILGPKIVHGFHTSGTNERSYEVW